MAAHGVLADAEVEVAAAVAVGLEVAGALEREAGLGGGGQVGRAADQPGHVLGRSRSAPCRDASRLARPLASAGKRRKVLVPAVGQLAVLHLLELVGQLGILASCTRANFAIQASRSSLAALADAAR